MLSLRMRWLAIVVAVWSGACTATQTPRPASVLLFHGGGSWPNDVNAIETILRGHRVDYSTVDSRQLTALDDARLGAYRLFIVPGGNFIEMSKGFTPETASHVRRAVGNGLNYLGICAGAILAGSPGVTSFDFTAGVRFPFYAATRDGIHKAVVAISRPGQPTLEHYWEDGPELSGWGTPRATYPDGTPAVVDGSFGRGHVVLTGVHPEAPENWRGGMTFRTSAADDTAYAWALIDAALNGTSLTP